MPDDPTTAGAPAPAQPGGTAPAQPGGTAPAQPASPTASVTSAAPSGDTAKVRVAWPLDFFEHGVEGVETLGREAIAVVKSKVPALLEAAKAAAVRLIVEEV